MEELRGLLGGRDRKVTTHCIPNSYPAAPFHLRYAFLPLLMIQSIQSPTPNSPSKSTSRNDAYTIKSTYPSQKPKKMPINNYNGDLTRAERILTHSATYIFPKHTVIYGISSSTDSVGHLSNGRRLEVGQTAL